MKQYNKIGLSTTDGFTSAFVDTPIGRFVLNAGVEEGYNEVFVSFQRDSHDGIVEPEQDLFHCQEEDGKLNCHLWKNEKSEDCTDDYVLKAISRKDLGEE